MKLAGLMSGTSLDGVDVALLESDGERLTRFGPGLERPYSSAERKGLLAAVDAALQWRWQGEAPSAFAEAERILTLTHGEAVEAVCAKAGLSPSELDAVGFHGQTVLHQAPLNGVKGRTLQLADGQALSDRLGCRVVYDFRTADVEAGGQGAPLVPVYHRALSQWSGLEWPLGVINIGGVANITHIAADGTLTAFDTGPGNGLIDAFVEARTGEIMDRNGEIAARGRIHEAAFAEFLDNPYFSRPGPKSLDRWDFSLDTVRNLSLEDGAATLTGLTAKTIAMGVAALPDEPRRLVLCGGGRRNATLAELVAAATGMKVYSAETLGWRGDLVEAEAFAFLAARVIAGLPFTYPGTTGVKAPMGGGKIVGGA
ncbi:MAG: anhydro-N-acetylmuramic acid kinase [Caulobacterales bacterium]|uniref:anhydro-N-acetylmuramic acid kinase n=1 Tax=Glycocaulis sp. TaxID=1969725 RepID=UPI003F9F87A4